MEQALTAQPETGNPVDLAWLRNRITDLALNRPGLADLSEAQVNKLAAAVLVDDLKDDLRRKVLSARIDWESEINAFLSDCKSIHTRGVYRRGLARLTAWLTHKGLAPSDLTPRTADDFIRELRAGTGDADSHRVIISAASSFFTFLERRYDECRNPFRGTRARPRSTWPTAIIPTAKEIAIITEAADPVLQAAVVVLLETGLRIGALVGLDIRADGTFKTYSKGKPFTGPDPLPAKATMAIKDAGLDPRRPFADLPQTKDATLWLKVRLVRLTGRLTKEGRIKAAYSAHDLRHAFTERHKAKGMHWLQSRLGHSGIGITEKYLRNTFDEKGD